MFHFVKSLDEIPEFPSSRVIWIDDSLQSEVIDKIEKAVDAPYEKDNWDGFRDAVRDLSWLKESGVVIIHKSLPKLDAWEQQAYIQILAEAEESFDGDQGIDFQVFFLDEDKAEVDMFTFMERYWAECESCGNNLLLKKIINNGADVLTAFCHCPKCGKNYVAEFDKLYDINKPDLSVIGPDGLDSDGFDADGYDKDGYDPRGFDRKHLYMGTSSPFNPSGYDWEGYDAEGLDYRGFDRSGFYRKTGAKYDENGYDWHGYNKDGYNKYGVDRYGRLPDGSDPEKNMKKRDAKELIVSVLIILLLFFMEILQSRLKA